MYLHLQLHRLVWLEQQQPFRWRVCKVNDLMLPSFLQVMAEKTVYIPDDQTKLLTRDYVWLFNFLSQTHIIVTDYDENMVMMMMTLVTIVIITMIIQVMVMIVIITI